MEIEKITRTDAGVDNSYYEIKTPYIDDYGNTYYRKEIRLCSEFDDHLQRAKTEINAVENEIAKLRKK